jgi:hypothetical protein
MAEWSLDQLPNGLRQRALGDIRVKVVSEQSPSTI